MVRTSYKQSVNFKTLFQIMHFFNENLKMPLLAEFRKKKNCVMAILIDYKLKVNIGLSSIWYITDVDM